MRNTSFNAEPAAIYKERIERNQSFIKKYKKNDLFFIVIKLLLFFGGLFLFFKFFPGNLALSFSILFLFFVLFFISSLIHEKILHKINHYRTLIRVNHNEQKILCGKFLAEINDGEEFNDPEHFYGSDLDIFGERSLFHHINRTVTAVGRVRLAQSLQQPCSVDEIGRRQDAVKELADKLDFRQNIQAYGMAAGIANLFPGTGRPTPTPSAPMGDKKNGRIFARFTGAEKENPAVESGEEKLYDLFDNEYILLGKKTAVFFIYFIPIVTLLLFISLSFKASPGVPLSAMAVQFIINIFLGKKISRSYRLTSGSGKVLKTYSRIIKEIEDESFADTKLINLKRDLRIAGEMQDIHAAATASGKNVKASQAIKKLAALMEWFDLRLSGMMHFLVNNTLFWDLHCVYRIEKWKKQSAGSVARWFAVIGEMEVLSTFANLYFNNPGWTLPEITAQGFRFKAVKMGHPLIPLKDRVNNDIFLNGAGNILVITGPNMAGKSTFLRTIGINCVLAFSGAPVCASHFEISPFRLITSMHSADSLDKQLSLFYAELMRLKLILDNIETNRKQKNNDTLPVFFLIDEMLKGTNTVDRQKGSIALLKQLIARQTNGAVATHDLKLTHLEKFGKGVRNFHFDGEIKDDKLIFDFKLKEGICKSANALILMKKVGIDLF